VLTSAAYAAFDPDLFPAARDLLMSKMMNPEAYRGRVANNALPSGTGANASKGCFADMTNFPDSCTWLDSQAAIEDAVGIVNIRRTEVSACTPVVFYGGKGVGR
jgi:hypothetical protein